MNGLIYFDQFALISPVHLGLVVLGIVILLAGVWVVSIQAGSGGVDVDRWQEGDESLSEDGGSLSEGSDTEPHDLEQGVQDSDQSQTLLARRGRARPYSFGPVRMERQSVSESHMPSLAHSPTRHHSLHIRPPTVEEIPSLPLPLTSPRTPPARRGTTPDSSLLLSPSTVRSRRRRRPTLQPSDTQHSFSPPLGGGSVLGGLSIGLGPMSPGFSIVPRDRRRKVSGFADVVESARGQRRRTVSEGDVRPWGDARLAESGEGSGAAAERAAQETVEGEAGKKKMNGRWKWVKKVFMDRRRGGEGR